MKENTYSDSGVNIKEANQLISNIKNIVKNTQRKEVIGNIGGFGGLFSLDTKKYNEPVLVSGADGVGTKLMIAQAMGKHDTIGIDLVAMCANDILCHGAEPLFFLDYIATGKLQVRAIEEILLGIAQGCKEAGMALTGGETAEMPGMYTNHKYDLAGFAIGVVERKKILPSKSINSGDVLLGLHSSGLHSNGFSLVRKILSDLKISLHDKSPWQNKTWGEILLEPTSIYVKPILSALENIKAIAHITGGGIIENIPRILPDTLTFNLSYSIWPEIFLWLQKEGKVTEKEMLNVFNCGIGMALVADKEQVPLLVKKLAKHNVTVQAIGEIIHRQN